MATTLYALKEPKSDGTMPMDLCEACALHAVNEGFVRAGLVPRLTLHEAVEFLDTLNTRLTGKIVEAGEGECGAPQHTTEALVLSIFQGISDLEGTLGRDLEEIFGLMEVEDGDEEDSESA